MEVLLEIQYCTAGGHADALAKRENLRKSICPNRESLSGTGANSFSEDMNVELAQRHSVEAAEAFALYRVNKFLENHRAALVPTQFKKAQVGHLVQYSYTDVAGVEQMKSAIIGGEDELALYKVDGIKVPVVFYQSPLGASLVSKPIGHDFTLTEKGVEYDAEIIALVLPPEPEPAFVVSKLSIDGTGARRKQAA